MAMSPVFAMTDIMHIWGGSMKSTAKKGSKSFIIAELSPGKIDDHVEWQ